MSHVVVLGATSPIARALAAELAGRGHTLHLAGRDAEELRRISADLSVRYGAPTRTSVFDAADATTHDALLAAVLEEAGDDLEGVVLAFGLTGDGERARHDPSHAREILEVNLVGAATLLTRLADHLEAQGRGWIVALSSVAGDRGRPSNYVYGAAKAGLTVFLQGLRARLARAGVHVLTVKLGFVDTRMTFGKEGVFAAAAPEAAARAILRALDARRDQVYVPRFWRLVMGMIRTIPEPLFKRLDL